MPDYNQSRIAPGYSAAGYVPSGGDQQPPSPEERLMAMSGMLSEPMLMMLARIMQNRGSASQRDVRMAEPSPMPPQGIPGVNGAFPTMSPSRAVPLPMMMQPQNSFVRG